MPYPEIFLGREGEKQGRIQHGVNPGPETAANRAPWKVNEDAAKPTDSKQLWAKCKRELSSAQDNT